MLSIDRMHEIFTLMIF